MYTIQYRRLGLFPFHYHPKSNVDYRFRTVSTNEGRKKKREKGGWSHVRVLLFPDSPMLSVTHTIRQPQAIPSPSAKRRNPLGPKLIGRRINGSKRDG
ncbi:hypothetical protein B296_00046564 [Ensete ventricosum]|uniref:Uncharacterized protein n=1 Tax=Ensete ventricosum TaxID=4639 RepID=A0A426YWX3_ENSVE|nr:hypothetical protein B296_00046564 [Ensete ventricosum]